MSFASFFLELFMSRSSDGLGFCGPFTVSAIPVLQAKPPEPSREEPLQVEEPKMDQENGAFHRGNLKREENRSLHFVSFSMAVLQIECEVLCQLTDHPVCI